jgi:hypothetical protein
MEMRREWEKSRWNRLKVTAPKSEAVFSEQACLIAPVFEAKKRSWESLWFLDGK